MAARQQQEEEAHAAALEAVQAETFAAMEVQAEQQERMAMLQQALEEVRCSKQRYMLLFWHLQGCMWPVISVTVN